MKRALLLGLLLSIAASGAAPAAPSSADADRARELYVAGSEAYDKGRYDVAISAFEGASQLNPGPELSFSLAQALRLQYFVDRDITKLERAVEQYRAYLEQTPEGGRRDHAAQHLAALAPILEAQRLDAANRQAREATEARLIVSSHTPRATARVDDGEPSNVPATFLVEAGPRRIRLEAPQHVAQVIDAVAVAGTVVPFNLDLQPTPGRLSLTAPEGVEVAVDGQTRGHTPLGAEALAVSPGRHVLTVGDNGRQVFRRELDLTPGQTLEVEATLPPTTQRWVAWGLLGTGGALAVGSGLGFLRAWSQGGEADDLRRHHASEGFTEAEASRYAELRRSRDDWRYAAIGLGVGAVVSLGVAALLYTFDPPDLAAAAR